MRNWPNRALKFTHPHDAVSTEVFESLSVGGKTLTVWLSSSKKQPKMSWARLPLPVSDRLWILILRKQEAKMKGIKWGKGLHSPQVRGAQSIDGIWPEARLPQERGECSRIVVFSHWIRVTVHCHGCFWWTVNSVSKSWLGYQVHCYGKL